MIPAGRLSATPPAREVPTVVVEDERIGSSPGVGVGEAEGLLEGEELGELAGLFDGELEGDEPPPLAVYSIYTGIRVASVVPEVRLSGVV